jgi:hypothetical protein
MKSMPPCSSARWTLDGKLLSSLTLARSHTGAAAVLIDELDASLPRQANWVRFVNGHLTGLWFRERDQGSLGQMGPLYLAVALWRCS